MKKDLKGSPSRDTFKQKHKEINPEFYASDLDFVLTTKYPFPDIVAAIDFKTANDEIGFSEVIAYNALVVRGINVYIVTGDPESGKFRIEKYIGGHHKKPRYQIELIATTSDWTDFANWELSLRGNWKRTFSP